MTSSDVTYFAFVIFYGLAVLNCVHVMGQRLTSGAAISWMFINLVFPFAGVPLYYLLGNQRIAGYTKRHRAAAAEVSGGTTFDRLPIPPAADTLPVASREAYGTLQRIFSPLGPEFQPHRACVHLLIDGKTTFAAIFDAIKKAESYILVQYYILRSDRLGLELKRLLIERAQSGVRVLLIYDDMGSVWLKSDYLKDLRAAGVRVTSFLPIASFTRFFQANFRNHRKTVVVDGKVAFTGGLNVGEEYAASKKQQKKSAKKGLRYWRDTHMKIVGPSVTLLEDIFFEDWYFATGQRVEDISPAVAARPVPAEPPADHCPSVVQIIPSGPTDPVVVPLLLLMQLIAEAKQRIWIATPYFVPDQSLTRSLELAVMRGVDVRIMIPSVSDNRVVGWVSHSFAEQMQSAGAKVLLYEAGFMHQKAILVDDIVGALGTLNIDNRALYLNFETTVLIHDPRFAAKLEDMFLKDFLSCRYLARPTGRFLSAFYRLRANIARLGAPLL